MVDIPHIAKVKSRVVSSESLLERGRHLSKPPPYFSLGIRDWEESDEDEMDALLLKAAELADGKLTSGSSDDEIDKILLEASCQFDPVSSPPLTGSDRFDGVATSSQIHQMHQDVIPLKTRQTTSWSTHV